MAHQTDSDQLFPDHPAVTTMKFVCIFVTVVGNGLVILAVSTNRIMRQVPSSMFVCSLAVADFLVGAVLMPADTFSVSLRAKEVDGSIEALVMFRFRTFLQVASMWNICTISYDRHFFITQHRHYASWMGRFRVGVLASAGWIYGAFLSLLWHVIQSSTNSVIIKTVIYNSIVVTGYDIPMIIILVLYVRTMCFLRKLNATSSDVREKGSGCCGSMRRYHMRQTLLLSSIILCLYILRGPSVAYCHFTGFGGGDVVMFHATDWISYSNSLVNPFLYAMVKERFRKSIVRLIRCRCRNADSYPEQLPVSIVGSIQSGSRVKDLVKTMPTPRQDQDINAIEWVQESSPSLTP